MQSIYGHSFVMIALLDLGYLLLDFLFGFNVESAVDTSRRFLQQCFAEQTDAHRHRCAHVLLSTGDRRQAAGLGGFEGTAHRPGRTGAVMK
jgi:hypothetical protein